MFHKILKRLNESIEDFDFNKSIREDEKVESKYVRLDPLKSTSLDIKALVSVVADIIDSRVYQLEYFNAFIGIYNPSDYLKSSGKAYEVLKEVDPKGKGSRVVVSIS